MFAWRFFLVLCLMSLAGMARSVAASEPLVSADRVAVLVDAAPEIFPAIWRGGAIDARATALSPAELRRSLAALQRAAGRYPQALIRQHLEAVVLVERLEYRGIRAAGTNSQNRVYLANRGRANGYTDAFLEQVFHAEFSSVLLRAHAHRFDADAWNGLNPVGFTYGVSGVDAVRQGRAGQGQDAALLAAGFLNQYATSTLENDFNAVVIALMTEGEIFNRQRRLNPTLDAKAKLVEAFYANLDAPIRFAEAAGEGTEDA